MGKAGSRVTVSKSAVTGVRIDPGYGVLTIEGVDLDKDGVSIRGHTLSYPPEPLPKAVADAIVTIRDFAVSAIDNA